MLVLPCWDHVGQSGPVAICAGGALAGQLKLKQVQAVDPRILSAVGTLAGQLKLNWVQAWEGVSGDPTCRGYPVRTAEADNTLSVTQKVPWFYMQRARWIGETELGIDWGVLGLCIEGALTR